MNKYENTFLCLMKYIIILFYLILFCLQMYLFSHIFFILIIRFIVFKPIPLVIYSGWQVVRGNCSQRKMEAPVFYYRKFVK